MAICRSASEGTRILGASSRGVPDAFGILLVYKKFLIFNKINKLIFLISDSNAKIGLPGDTLEMIMKCGTLSFFGAKI